MLFLNVFDNIYYKDNILGNIVMNIKSINNINYCVPAKIINNSVPLIQFQADCLREILNELLCRKSRLYYVLKKDGIVCRYDIHNILNQYHLKDVLDMIGIKYTEKTSDIFNPFIDNNILDRKAYSIFNKHMKSWRIPLSNDKIISICNNNSHINFIKIQKQYSEMIFNN